MKPDKTRRAILIVLDSVGIGEAPDAAEYGDTGANTFAHLADANGGIKLPILKSMGLGNIPPILPKGKIIKGVQPTNNPIASYGALQEVSQGKDTTTGHWEMAGLQLDTGFTVLPAEAPSFPLDLIAEFEKRTGRKAIANYAASGTTIIAELGEQQMKEGCWIVYTSADSVFQLAAHEEIIPLEKTYQACEIARELCNPLHIGRVIARPYIGTPGNFTRTDNRKDYSYPISEPTILSRLSDKGIEVTTVGKIDDIFDHQGITNVRHSENNHDAKKDLLNLIKDGQSGFIFVNFIDFDMLYGHRRNPQGYAKALEDIDLYLAELIPLLDDDDLLMISADHGNDPTFKGSDHTREYVPIISYNKTASAKNIGIRQGFFDVAQSIAKYFNIEPIPRGKSFI